MRLSRGVISFLFLLPALAIYGIFTLAPLFYNMALSTLDITGPGIYTYAGVNNYIELVKDPIFHTALLHNIIWVVLTLIFPMLVGLILATFSTKVKGNTLIITTYFIPRAIPFVVSGVIWSLMYNPIFGPLHFLLQGLGLEYLERPWLGDSKTALYALNFAGGWTFFGFCSLIFFNALQNVDPRLYEAAEIDGASSWQRFIHITLPSLRDAIIFLTFYSTITAMSFFDLVHITTRGGPGYATEILSTYIYRLVFREGRLGYGSSICVILTLLTLLITAFILSIQWREK